MTFYGLFLLCVYYQVLIVLPYIDVWALYSYDSCFFINLYLQGDVILMFSLL